MVSRLSWSCELIRARRGAPSHNTECANLYIVENFLIDANLIQLVSKALSDFAISTR